VQNSSPKSRRRSVRRLLVLASAAILAAANPSTARAQNRATLPPAVQQKAPGLQQIGKGSQNYLGLKVYNVTLWAPNTRWNPDEPHALDLESNRAISANQLTDAGMGEMNRLALGTPQQRQAWRAQMAQLVPPVSRGDQVVVFNAPNHKTYFFYNGRERGSIDDPAFGSAFFSIWLDPRTKNQALRRSLLNH
jgi:hypothetical protein